jgi:acetyl-CoA carboxylase biotin carboxyl carrier protein
MNIEEIKELIATVNETGIAELEVQRGENRVRIKRTVTAATAHEIAFSAPPAAAVAPQSVQQHADSIAAASAPAGAAAAAEPAIAEPENLTYVTSPIVGTFYESGAPGAAPFVKIGDVVSPGQVLCIIESMKLMNEIESEVSGVIVSKLVENGRPVEYGEALFAVRPV